MRQIGRCMTSELIFCLLHGQVCDLYLILKCRLLLSPVLRLLLIAKLCLMSRLELQRELS